MSVENLSTNRPRGEVVSRSEEHERYHQAIEDWVQHKITYEELQEFIPVSEFSTPELRIAKRIERFIKRRVKAISLRDGSKV